MNFSRNSSYICLLKGLQSNRINLHMYTSTSMSILKNTCLQVSNSSKRSSLPQHQELLCRNLIQICVHFDKSEVDCEESLLTLTALDKIC